MYFVSIIIKTLLRLFVLRLLMYLKQAKTQKDWTPHFYPSAYPTVYDCVLAFQNARKGIQASEGSQGGRTEQDSSSSDAPIR